MKRGLGAAVAALICVASVVAACGSSGPQITQPPRTPAAPTSPGLSPTLPATPVASPSPTPALASPSEPVTDSPTPSQLPEVTYSPAPQPSLALTAAGSPSLPTGLGLSYPSEQCSSSNADEPCEWLRVTWREANPSGVTIRIYAVTACLHTPTASQPNAQCLVNGDTIPAASLLIMGTAPASARSFAFVLTSPYGEGNFSLGALPGGGPEVDSIVLQAVDRDGGSLFAFVATSSAGCYGCIL